MTKLEQEITAGHKQIEAVDHLNACGDRNKKIYNQVGDHEKAIKQRNTQAMYNKTIYECTDKAADQSYRSSTHKRHHQVNKGFFFHLAHVLGLCLAREKNAMMLERRLVDSRKTYPL